MIKLSNIHFSYNDKPFIEGLNIHIGRGELVTVLGPNGSGKSTVIKILTGEKKPSYGSVDFESRSIHEIPVRELATRMSVMTQNAQVSFPYTCLEVIQMGLYPHKELSVATDMGELEYLYGLMKRTQTQDFAQKLITEVSGGEAQRVLMTRILAQNTPVVVLDEAFSAMDIAHKLDMIRIMRGEVERNSKTVVAVMHDLNMAYMNSDRVILMKEGRVVADGPTDEVMTPRNLHEVFGIHFAKIEGRGFLVEQQA